MGGGGGGGTFPVGSTDIDALRNVQFVMKNGMVFKKDGVMMPEKFFHPGPVRIPGGRWTR